jgi:hypothetical protein
VNTVMNLRVSERQILSSVVEFVNKHDSPYQCFSKFRQSQIASQAVGAHANHPDFVKFHTHPKAHVGGRLGGLVVSLLMTGPKCHEYKLGRGDGFLRAIKIRSTPSFGCEVKPEVSCRKILHSVKDPLLNLRC